MAPSSVEPIRVMHVVGGMERAGTETWLMHVLRNIDRDKFQMDFVVHTDHSCAFDEEIRALGSKVIPCLNRSNPLAYARNLNRIMRRHGPYDVVHSHVHNYSGYVLWLARRAKVPMRIAHSHLDTSDFDNAASYARRLYVSLTKQMVKRNATLGLAASEKAAIALFGEDWATDARWQILYCGIDLNPFAATVESATVRAELGIPADAFVMGHVGRFMEQKNHGFLIDIAAEVARREPNTRLLLVGDGLLQEEIRQKIVDKDLADYVIMAGVREDVARLMLGAIDVFVFPSLYEGLGLVLIEAQAAGLPCVISDVIPSEADLDSRLISRLPLATSASEWADVVLTLNRRSPRTDKTEHFLKVKRSDFNIESSMRELVKAYHG